MRNSVLLGLFISALLAFASPGAAAECDPVGGAQFVCNQLAPEDLALVPGGKWVISSGYAANGALRLINVADKTTTVLFPSASAKEQQDRKVYASCPGPIDPEEKEKFRAHGLYLRPGKNLIHTLYMVHHGNRESVEIFQINARGEMPTLTWIGCAVAPDKTSLNAVAALPDGGFAATNFQTTGGGDAYKGEISGEVWEWHKDNGWTKVPGSETSGANGLEISKDGKWYYISGWGTNTFIRLSRGKTPFQRDTVPVGFHLDNIRMSPDGTLLGAGSTIPPGPRDHSPDGLACVDRIDPKTMKVQELVRYHFNDVFVGATGALQVGNEIWVGSVRTPANRIARFPADKVTQQ